MCAEFSPEKQKKIGSLFLEKEFKVELAATESQGRIFPRTLAPILVTGSESKTLKLIESEFSLIPFWWNPAAAKAKTKNNRPVFATHNARLETVLEKPAFKESFKKFRCLIPIEKFFESSLFGTKYPGNRICVQGAETLLAAGCYSEWLDKSSGELTHSFTILTTNPNEQILSAGHDRMPVFLSLDAALDWLDRTQKTPEQLKDFLLAESVNKKLQFDISIDRPLKPGWEKNAPSPEELELLRQSL